MKLKLEIAGVKVFDFEFGVGKRAYGKSHHNTESEKLRREMRHAVILASKSPCVVCGGKITEVYRQKTCSMKCEALLEKTRRHRKKQEKL